jgi:Pyruvate/2-oxoacid:ferredoxin oxidoreductase delta subunit
MTKEFKEKIIALGKYMNGNSSFSVPLVPAIIDCFELVMTEEEVDYLLKLKNDSFTKQELQKLWEVDDKEFERLFSQMMSKCLMWQTNEGRFELIPIFPGWIEMFASGPQNDTRRQVIERFGEFEELLKKLNIAPVRAYMNHVNTNRMKKESGKMSTAVARGSKKVELNRKLTSEQAVYTEGEVYPLIEKNREHLAVMNCFCRLKKQIAGHMCEHKVPLESCMALGRMADQLVEGGLARSVTFDEAVAMVKEFEDLGCIHTLYHYRISSDEEEAILCNCCVDCCFLYNSYQEGALSQLLIKAYYKPQMLDGDKCVGCNQCYRYCPTSATWYDKDNKKLEFDISKCIGCGQCVTQCRFNVREMVRDERNVFVKTRPKKALH